MHVHNVRDFPQARPDIELKSRFLLNEHGYLYFLLHNNSSHVMLFNLKKKMKKFQVSEGKKDIADSVHKIVTVGCKL